MSISAKITFVVTLCVAAAIGGVEIIVTDFTRNEIISKARSENGFIAQAVASLIARQIDFDLEKMSSLALVTGNGGGDSAKKITSTLAGQTELVSFGVYRPTGQGYVAVAFDVKNEVLNEMGLQKDFLQSTVEPALEKQAARKPDGVFVVNSGALLKRPLLTLAFLNEKGWLVRSEIKQISFQNLFGPLNDRRVLFVDGEGNLLGRSDTKTFTDNASVISSGIFSAMHDGASETGDLIFSNENGRTSVGGFARVRNDGGVISEVDQAEVLKPIERLRYRCFLVGLMVLGMAWILSILYSDTITSALHYLRESFIKLTMGQFDANFQVVRSDEVGDLAIGFKQLVQQLQDKERYHGTLSKVSTAEDAAKVVKGEINLSYERRGMTVLLCEVSHFQVNEMDVKGTFKQLEDFWGHLAGITKRYLGFVDYVGTDSMRVVWGTLGQINDGGSSAVTTALEIRKYMGKFNEKREAKGHAPVKIHMAIHAGEMLGGQFKRSASTEYTVAGEGVLVTSELLAAARGLEADIVVSDVVEANLESKGFVFGPKVTAANELCVYQVLGTKSQYGALETDLSVAQQNTISRAVETTVEFKPVEEKTTTTPAPHLSQAAQAPAAPTIVPVMVPVAAPAPAPVAAPAAVTQTVLVPVQVAAPIQEPAPFSQTNATFIQPMQNTSPFYVDTNTAIPQAIWYLMRNVQTGVAEGPLTVTDLRTLVEQPGFPVLDAYAFRHGDSVMTPVMQVPGLSRRRPPPPIPKDLAFPSEDLVKKAKQEEWFIRKEDNQIYGPYSLEQLVKFIETNQITRTTYCWKQGLLSWQYAYQLPGIDRRGTTPPPAPLPMPSNKAS